ncbi:hypothetical protein [Segetibacter aerophilus]|uniref:Uncharacterized protein n=1 Tax=Segetibacter aerophilus TaxID=670293 RepID=A0A512B9X5_9BACT|nr:hypothetical protein [Segetibacter aerophilus]GEO08770.1 hypothetical protein SAE01_12660 [Segetibacter aerophilus]
MPKFGVLLNSLSGKAGIKPDDETLKKLLAFVEVSQFELPDEFANALERNLLTQESAAANPDVRSKIFAEALNGVDAELERSVGDFEFDDSFKGELKGIKSTHEKVRRITAGLKDQLKAAKEKANKTGDPKDKAEVDVLKKEIENANTQMNNLKLMHQTEIDNLKTANLNDKKEFTLKSKLAGKPLPKNGLPPEINILTAKTLISQEMAKQGIIVTFDEAGNPVLKQRKDGADIDYFVDNKKIDYDNFVDGVLASNKFVQINDPNPAPNPGQGNNPPQPQRSFQSNAGVVSEIDGQLRELGITV